MHRRRHLLFLLLDILYLAVAVRIDATATPAEGELNVDYYKKSCPNLQNVVQQTVTDKQIKTSSTGAGVLRLIFHDCFATGCDASILISSNSFNKAERDADINLSLPGDAFDVVVCMYLQYRKSVSLRNQLIVVLIRFVLRWRWRRNVRGSYHVQIFLLWQLGILSSCSADHTLMYSLVGKTVSPLMLPMLWVKSQCPPCQLKSSSPSSRTRVSLLKKWLLSPVHTQLASLIARNLQTGLSDRILKLVKRELIWFLCCLKGVFQRE